MMPRPVAALLAGTICKGGGCVCPPQKPNMCSYKCTNKMIDPLNCEW